MTRPIDWHLMPPEATEEMLDAGGKPPDYDGTDPNVLPRRGLAAVYRAMVKARPKVGAAE